MNSKWINAAVIAATALAGTSMTLVSGSALAQAASAPTPAAAPTSPAKKELVAKLLAIQQPGIEALARSLAEQPIAEMMMPVRQALQTRIAADKRDATGKAIEADIRKYIDEAVPLLRDRAIKLAPTTLGTSLDEKFSEDELRQLLAWFESPVSKKYQQVSPELQNALVAKLVAETRPSIEGKLRALDQSISQKLGIPAPPPASGATK